PTPTPTPLPRGGNLTIRLKEDIAWLQPWRPRSRGEEQVISLLYNGLMSLDARLRPQPDLAESWIASADGRILTFTLRSGITWHDGTPLNSVDVHFTLDRMLALPVTRTALLNDLHLITSVTTPDRRTVVIRLAERYAPMLSHLTLPILPRHLLENKDLASLNFWDIPIGTGPFKFERRDRGRSIVLSAYEHYHRGAPLLSLVAFVGASNEQVALQALQDGRLLLAETEWNTVQNYTGTLDMLHLGGYPENGFYFLGFNLREGRPFADIRVRQALARAMDLPRLVEASTRGQGIPIASSAAPGSWADLTDLASTAPDLDSARQLLTEAGWTLQPGMTIRQQNGVPFQATLVVLGDDPRRVAAAQHIVDVAATIGLPLTIEPISFSDLMAAYVPPYDFDLLLGSWVNGAGDPGFSDYAYYDPDDFALFHSSQVNQGELDQRVTRNVVGFSDPAYDSEAEAARQLYAISERLDHQRKAQARIASLLPYLYLWADTIPVLLNQRVTTLDGPVDLSTPAYLWNIERWHLTNDRE
ncbi:MAG: peptide ABC transporter substrate-binding protein, partial [Chloroflexaceae bacterium]|nr:peptide ABC transporter substrate-binding protein [Chloroflexaceae bacterium]